MKKRVVCVVLFCLCLYVKAWAGEDVSLQDRMVGGTFKTMAKAYIATADVQVLKEKNIKRIEIMREDWFERQYADVYKVIKDLPPRIKDKYRIKAGMTKAEAVTVIRSLDKRQINTIIDAIPDPVIAGQFNEQWRSEGDGTKGDLMGRIQMIWGKVMAAVNAPSGARK